MIKIQVPPSELRKLRAAMDGYQKLVGKTNEEMTVELSKSCAKQLANWTEPVGLKKGRIDEFKESIIKQVKKAMLRGYIKNVSGGAAELHQAARNSKGVVPRGETKGKFQREPLDESEVMAYVRKVVDRAAMAKASWIAAADKIKGKKISGQLGWASKLRKKNTGASMVVADPKKSSVTLTSTLEYAGHRLTNVEKALRAGYRNQALRMAHAIRKLKKTI